VPRRPIATGSSNVSPLKGVGSGGCRRCLVNFTPAADSADSLDTNGARGGHGFLTESAMKRRQSLVFGPSGKRLVKFYGLRWEFGNLTRVWLEEHGFRGKSCFLKWTILVFQCGWPAIEAQGA
jgi:hypothetical protein